MGNKLIHAIKNNWKAIVFSAAYLLLVYLSLAVASTISSLDGDLKISLLIPTFITLISLCSIAARFVLNAVFKNDVEKIIRNVYIILAPTLFFAVVGLLCSFIVSVPFPYSNSSDLSLLLSLVAIPMYFILLALFAGILFVFSFFAFMLLRLAMKHIKLVSLICVISWIASIFIVIH